MRAAPGGSGLHRACRVLGGEALLRWRLAPTNGLGVLGRR